MASTSRVKIVGNFLIAAFYENNDAQFIIPESVNASHILICHEESTRCEANRTKEEALSLAEEVLVELETKDFAEAAVEYSEGTF